MIRKKSCADQTHISTQMGILQNGVRLHNKSDNIALQKIKDTITAKDLLSQCHIALPCLLTLNTTFNLGPFRGHFRKFH